MKQVTLKLSYLKICALARFIRDAHYFYSTEIEPELMLRAIILKGLSKKLAIKILDTKKEYTIKLSEEETTCLYITTLEIDKFTVEHAAFVLLTDLIKMLDAEYQNAITETKALKFQNSQPKQLV